MHIGKSMVARVTSSFFRLLILVEVEFDGGGGGRVRPRWWWSVGAVWAA
jgi:hypothetical protein